MSEAIKRIRVHSSSGLNGLPAAFYQISPDKNMNYQLARGTFLRSQKEIACHIAS